MRNVHATRLAVLIGLLTATTGSVRAEVLGIHARTSSLVTQWDGGEEVQRDSSEAAFPDTQTSTPIISRARLNQDDEHGDTVAGAECVAVFTDPRNQPASPPRDVGIDLGTFSLDGLTSFEMDGSVSERRTIRFTADELGLNDGEAARVRSLLYVVGAFIVIAEDPQEDLTGLKIELLTSITQTSSGGEPATVLTGRATLEGGPNGALTASGNGAVDPAMLPLIDLLPLAPDLPGEGVNLARVLAFPAVAFPYQYDVTVGQSFDLELVVGATIKSVPRNVGAAAVFGLPQQNFTDVLARIRGSAVADSVAAAVTAAADPAAEPPAPQTTITPLPSVCGIVGLEGLLFPGLLGAGWIIRRGSPRRGRRLQ